MSLLLDTHALLWWLRDDPRISPRVRALLQRADSELVWSAVGTWELAIKSGLGRISFEEPLRTYVPRIIEREGLRPLAIGHVHAMEVEQLPHHHRDPFDRLLVAQARVEGLTLVSSDRQLRAYDVDLLW